MVQTQFGVSIKCLRSNNAKELALTQFLASMGTLHQFSCVERPEQNSVVERKHQHLLNVARALFFHSKVPISFWGDCVTTAAFLINKTPSPLLQHNSPYNILFKKEPDYHALRSFSCLAFASTLPSSRNKFSPRAIPVIFVGYPQGYKGYKLYSLDTKKFFVSRDVVFHESIFPFQTISQPQVIPDPLLDLVIPIPLTNTLPNPDQNTSQSLHPPNSFTLDPNDSPLILGSDQLDPFPSATLRRSTCHSKPPLYLSDYVISQSQAAYPIQHHCSLLSLSPPYRAFINHISAIYESQFYHQATPYPEWRRAMNEEIQTLEANSTWTLVPLPLDKHYIGCGWVYKVKYKMDGSVDR